MTMDVGDTDESPERHERAERPYRGAPKAGQAVVLLLGEHDAMPPVG